MNRANNRSGQLFRVFMISLLLFALLFLALSAVVLVFRGYVLLAGFQLLLTVVFWQVYRNSTFATFRTISNATLVLNDGRRILQIHSDDIAYAVRSYNPSLSPRYPVYIGLKEGRWLSRKRVVVLNDSEDRVMGFLRRSGVRLIND